MKPRIRRAVATSFAVAFVSGGGVCLDASASEPPPDPQPAATAAQTESERQARMANLREEVRIERERLKDLVAREDSGRLRDDPELHSIIRRLSELDAELRQLRGVPPRSLYGETLR